MAKKKRIKNTTVFGCVEGKAREMTFINFLEEIYRPNDNNINFTKKSSSGGTPDKIVTMALRECSRNRSFAWLDEDFEPEPPLSEETRSSLAK